MSQFAHFFSKGLLLLLSLLLSGSLSAQKHGHDHDFDKFQFHYQKTKLSERIDLKRPIASTRAHEVTKAVLKFFETGFPTLAIELVRETESPGGFHYRYQQMHVGLPVFNAFVDVVVSKKAILMSLTHSLEWVLPQEIAAYPVQMAQVARKWCLGNRRTFPTELSYGIFFIAPASSQAAIWFDTVDDLEATVRTFIDLEGNVLFEERHCHYFAPPVDSLSSGWVFFPDPLTSAEAAYGDPYFDNEDQNNAALEGELRQVDLQTTYNEVTGNFELSNEAVIIINDDAGNKPELVNFGPTVSAQGEFHFNRSEFGFEEVNAFYHITRAKDFYNSLGFEMLCLNNPVRVDARAAFGSELDLDNSFYNPGAHKIRFGLGGIDDAEDADVVVHEYGHALSGCANGNQSLGQERDAVEEGMGDYFAASYSSQISDYNAQKVFSWDGNYDGWEGRAVNTVKVYPDDLGGDQYQDGEIWSSVMMEIWAELGAETTDALMLQALYAFSSNMSMSDAAEAVREADDLLFDSENFNVLTRYFHKRGLVDFIAEAGEDREICIGESTTLGGKLSDLFESKITWTPSAGLDDPSALHPVASPATTTVYTVTIEDFLRDEVYTDGVRVKALSCLEELYSDEVEVLNSEAFATVGGGLIVRLPETAVVKGFFLFDSGGRQIAEWPATEDNLPFEMDDCSTNVSGFSTGVFFLEVRLEEESKVFKIFKGR